MTEAEKTILIALAWMCQQYISEDGELDHLCMSAGEGAVEVLASYGLVEPSARGGVWTAAGQALVDL